MRSLSLLLIAATACGSGAASAPSMQSTAEPSLQAANDPSTPSGSHGQAPAFTPTAFSVAVHGRGRPVILIPGLGCPGDVWSEIAARLDGFETHTLTLAGFAGTPRIDAPLSAKTRDELARYIRAHRLDHPIVIGHSMGGYIAYWLAASEPALVGPTIIVDAAPTFGPDDPDAVEAAGVQARSVWSDASDEQFTRQVQASFASMSAQPSRLRSTIDAVARSDRRAMGDAVYEMVTHDLRPQLSHIRAPVLLVLADGSLQDTYRQHARAVPNHEVVVLPGTRHFVFVDDPDGFVTAIKRFLGSRTQLAAG
ncbi:MAG TPA: alpha/beta hydrolase [Kofleriaceae bacterium]|nr:alpha/beta hydrolase [Kofleriaceae bacterium]